MRKLAVEGCGVVHSADSDVQGPRATQLKTPLGYVTLLHENGMGE